MGRRADSAVWGLVGGFTFLVLVQGFELLGGPAVAATVKLGVTAAVAATVGAVAYLVAPRLAANERA